MFFFGLRHGGLGGRMGHALTVESPYGTHKERQLTRQVCTPNRKRTVDELPTGCKETECKIDTLVILALMENETKAWSTTLHVNSKKNIGRQKEGKKMEIVTKKIVI